MVTQTRDQAGPSRGIRDLDRAKRPAKVIPVTGNLASLTTNSLHILRGCPITEPQIKITALYNHLPTRVRLPQLQGILGLLTPKPTGV